MTIEIFVPDIGADEVEVTEILVKVGDKVLFGKYSGQTVKVGDDELLVMREDDVMAIVE